MPTQVYECEVHGEFDLTLSFRDEVPQEVPCPHSCGECEEAGYEKPCQRMAVHVIKPPAGVKFARTWNEKANEYQRDPYTQAKAQTENAYNTAREHGNPAIRPTEEGIQVAAAQIDKQNKKDRLLKR